MKLPLRRMRSVAASVLILVVVDGTSAACSSGRTSPPAAAEGPPTTVAPEAGTSSGPTQSESPGATSATSSKSAQVPPITSGPPEPSANPRFQYVTQSTKPLPPSDVISVPWAAVYSGTVPPGGYPPPTYPTSAPGITSGKCLEDVDGFAGTDQSVPAGRASVFNGPISFYHYGVTNGGTGRFRDGLEYIIAATGTPSTSGAGTIVVVVQNNCAQPAALPERSFIGQVLAFSDPNRLGAIQLYGELNGPVVTYHYVSSTGASEPATHTFDIYSGQFR